MGLYEILETAVLDFAAELKHWFRGPSELEKQAVKGKEFVQLLKEIYPPICREYEALLDTYLYRKFLHENIANTYLVVRSEIAAHAYRQYCRKLISQKELTERIDKQDKFCHTLVHIAHEDMMSSKMLLTNYISNFTRYYGRDYLDVAKALKINYDKARTQGFEFSEQIEDWTLVPLSHLNMLLSKYRSKYQMAKR